MLSPGIAGVSGFGWDFGVVGALRLMCVRSREVEVQRFLQGAPCDGRLPGATSLHLRDGVLGPITGLNRQLSTTDKMHGARGYKPTQDGKGMRLDEAARPQSGRGRGSCEQASCEPAAQVTLTT